MVMFESYALFLHNSVGAWYYVKSLYTWGKGMRWAGLSNNIENIYVKSISLNRRNYKTISGVLLPAVLYYRNKKCIV